MHARARECALQLQLGDVTSRCLAVSFLRGRCLKIYDGPEQLPLLVLQTSTLWRPRFGFEPVSSIRAEGYRPAEDHIVCELSAEFDRDALQVLRGDATIREACQSIELAEAHRYFASVEAEDLRRREKEVSAREAKMSSLENRVRQTIAREERLSARESEHQRRVEEWQAHSSWESVVLSDRERLLEHTFCERMHIPLNSISTQTEAERPAPKRREVSTQTGAAVPRSCASEDAVGAAPETHARKRVRFDSLEGTEHTDPEAASARRSPRQHPSDHELPPLKTADLACLPRAKARLYLKDMGAPQHGTPEVLRDRLAEIFRLNSLALYTPGQAVRSHPLNLDHHANPGCAAF